ncbi:MAG: hypothetical protein FWF59_02370, partial [Turicibacter sp.]|nr:hypothetical protein [Turicibacter sp.]
MKKNRKFQHLKKKLGLLKKVTASVLSIAMAAQPLSLTAFAAHDDQEIYSLATDGAVQDLPVGTQGDAVVATAYLNRSGNAALEIVEHPHGGRSIQVSDRGASHYGIDIQREALGLVEGQRYSIRIGGRVLGTYNQAPDAQDGNIEDEIPAEEEYGYEAPAPLSGQWVVSAGTQVILGGPDSPWNWAANAAPDAAGNFNFTAQIASAQMADPQFIRGFRIQTNNTDTFIIDEIVVTWYGVDNTWVPPVVAQPELPEVVPGTLFSLVADEGIQGLEVGRYDLPGLPHAETLFNVTPFLQRAGQPTVTVVEYEGRNALQFTNRSASYHTVDLTRSPLFEGGLEMEEGHLYTIRFAGHVLNGTVDNVIIGGAESGWGWLANTAPAADGSFDLAVQVTTAQLAGV